MVGGWGIGCRRDASGKPRVASLPLINRNKQGELHTLLDSQAAFVVAWRYRKSVHLADVGRSHVVILASYQTARRPTATSPTPGIRTMNRRWFAMLPDAPVTATLIVFFQLRVREASSCNDIKQKQHQ